MKVFALITVASSLFAIASALPFKHNRRSASSNRVGSLEPEVVVRTPMRERDRVRERKLGEHCQNDSQLSLFKLSGRSAATCNDGTQAGYYLLRRPSSSKWLIFLEGGWYCADEATCKLRQQREPRLTSSRGWHPCKRGDGIFSASSNENPHLHGSNMVYIPYCSSDVWSGTARRRILGDVTFSFLGSVIIEQVVQQLLNNHGMQRASVVIVAGSSAGGTGVFMNVDRIQNYIRAAGSDAKVRGVVDSAWYLLRPEMDLSRPRCSNPVTCSPVSVIKMGASLWQPNIPQSCLSAQKRGKDGSPNASRFYSQRQRDDKWKCFFGSAIYPHIEAELFLVQWMFDPVQLQSDHVNLMNYNANTNKLLKYIKRLYNGLNDSFTPVKALFVTSCVSHAVLDRSDWHSASVAHVSLPDAIQCWEVSLDSASDAWESDNDVRQSERPSDNSVDGHRQQLHNGEDEDNDRGSEFASAENMPDDDDYDSYYAVNYLNDTPEPSTISPTQCKKRLIDPCPLPQCNPTCRPFYDRSTHTRINQIEFLERLGIDIRSIARRRGSNAAQLLVDLSRG